MGTFHRERYFAHWIFFSDEYFGGSKNEIGSSYLKERTDYSGITTENVRLSV